MIDPLFSKAVEELNISVVLAIPEEELRSQFFLFHSRLGNFNKTSSSESLDSKALLKRFFSSKEGNYRGIEMVLHVLAVASTKVSCESVLESFVSRYENHFDSRRNMSEDGANEEFLIAQNGPPLGKCDVTVRKAMESYWGHRSKWHFTRTAKNIKAYTLDSKVLDKTANRKSHLGFIG